MRYAPYILIVATPLCHGQDAPAAAPGRAAAAIDWNAYQAALRAAGPHAERTRAGNIGDAVRRTALPVLLATHGDVRAAPDFRTQGTSYVAHYRPGPSMEISVLGSASHIVSTLPGTTPRADPAGYQFDVLEDVTDLTFTRFGATYTIRASCADAADPRCQKPDYLVAFMRSLIPVAR